MTNRLEVPPTGRAVAFLVFVAIVGFFTWVAFYLLLNAHALTNWEVGGSLIWLALVALWVVTPIVEAGGLYGCFVTLVGIFARCGVIEIQSSSTGDLVLRTGFRLCGRDFMFSPIAVSQIAMVNWHHGQGSSVTGRDCDDWSVAVWYAKSKSVHAWGSMTSKDKGIAIVTPGLPKERANAIGLSVVSLLQSAGAPLGAFGAKSGFEGEFAVESAIRKA